MNKHIAKIFLLTLVFVANFQAMATRKFYVLTVNFNSGAVTSDAAFKICTNDSLFINLTRLNSTLPYSNAEASNLNWTVSAYDAGGVNVFNVVTAVGSSMIFYGGLQENSILNVVIDSLGKNIDTGPNIGGVRLSPTLQLGPDVNQCPGTTKLIQNLSTTGGNYKWSTGSTATGITVNSQGTYTVTITSAYAFVNCNAIDDINFTRNAKPEIEAGGTRYRCFGETLELNAVSTNPLSTPTAYEWKPQTSLVDNINTNQNAIVKNNVNNISFTVVGTNAFGCKDTSTVKVLENAELSIKISRNDTTLCKFVSVSLPIERIKNGAGVTASDYTYKWSPSLGLSNTTLLSPMVQAVTSTGISYITTVTDLNACTAKDTVTIRSTTLAMNFVTPVFETLTICSSEILSNLKVTRKGGVGFFIFNWQPASLFGNQPNDSLKTTFPIRQNEKILVTVTDRSGCTDKDSILVKVKLPPASQLGDKAQNLCLNTDKQFTLFSPDSAAKYEVVWNPNLRINNIRSYQPVFTGASAESNDAQLYVYTITSNANNCKFSDSLKLTTKAPTVVNIEGASRAVLNQDISFTASPAGLQYAWLVSSIAGTFDFTPSIKNEQILATKFTLEGNYIVSLTGINSFGCVSSSSKDIAARNASVNILYVPTIFSPGAEKDENKALRVFFSDGSVLSEGFKFSVFSTLGNKVFESTDLEKMKAEGWAGEGYPSGVYTWVVQCNFADDTAYKKANTVTLLR